MRPPSLITEKKSRFDDAVLAATSLEHKRLAVERELQSVRWAGYRFLSPLAATRLFYDEYRAQRIEYVRVHKDVELAGSLPRISFDKFIEDPANLAAAWSARQAADAHGVPYGLYIQFSFWFRSRRSGRRGSFVPQINQLAYNKRTEQAWLAEFAKYRREHLSLHFRLLGDVPQLLVGSFIGTPEQNHGRDVIVEHCRASSSPVTSLIETWCHLRPILTPDHFESIFSADVVATAMERVDTSLAATPELAHEVSTLLWPTCHGLPTTLDAAHEQCANCSFADSCGRLAAMVQDEVFRQTGYEEPRKRALRAPMNKRMREKRARDKLAALSEIAEPSSLPGVSVSMPEMAIA